MSSRWIKRMLPGTYPVLTAAFIILALGTLFGAALAAGQATPELKTAVDETVASIIYNSSLPNVMADETQIVQLFQNLIGNSLKFRSSEPPKIHITAEKHNNEWVFSVTDNGIGIDPQYEERIFTIFQRLHDREEYPGSGIGLAVCKKIVECHGGKIWMESEPGHGASFYFTIPVNRRK